MKSKVFKSPRMIFEFESVSAVIIFEDKLIVKLFGNHEHAIDNAEDMANFLIWYNIYLEDKHVEEVKEEEEIVGL